MSENKKTVEKYIEGFPRSDDRRKDQGVTPYLMTLNTSIRFE